MNEKEYTFIETLVHQITEKYPQEFYYKSFLSDLKYKRIIMTQESYPLEKEWITKCQKVIEKIQAITNNLRINVKYIKDVKRAEDASKMDRQAMHMTIKDSKLWKEKENGQYSVEFIHTNAIEDDIAIYENKFIKLLIDKLHIFIKTYIYQLSKEMGSVYQTFKSFDVSYQRVDEISAYKRYHRQKFSVLTINEDETAKLYNQLYQLEKKMMQLKNSTLYLVCSKEKDIQENIQMTNIIINEPNYNYCYKFYKKLKDTYAIAKIDSIIYFNFVILKLFEALHQTGFDEPDSKEKKGFSYDLDGCLELKNATFFKEDVLLFINTLPKFSFEIQIIQMNMDQKETLSCKLFFQVVPSFESSFSQTQLDRFIKKYQQEKKYDMAYIITADDLDFSQVFSIQTTKNETFIDFIYALGSTLEGMHIIYDKKCPVCGSMMILKDEKDLNCTICHSSWSLLTRREKQYVWIKAKKLD